MATVKDVARRSGVSTATVSYVVNNGPRAVNPATRDRVLEAIAYLNYRPSAAARSLKRKRTDTIGVVFPHMELAPFENDYFGPIITGILDSATKHGINSLLYTGLGWDQAEDNCAVYVDGRCDGLILIAPPRTSRLFDEVAGYGMVAVSVGTIPDGIHSSTVDVDNIEGARLAARHLLDLGHRDIVMIQGTESSTSTEERTEGFCLAHRECDLSVRAEQLVPSEYVREPALRSAREVLARKNRPTAIFACDDGIAYATLLIARELGISVPRQLSIVGFNDTATAAAQDPPLTSVRQPLREIGARAADLLLQDLSRKGHVPVDLVLPCELIVRASTTTPPES
jgi:DNA-binding LacI/PurR family transcriptional regulator